MLNKIVIEKIKTIPEVVGVGLIVAAVGLSNPALMVIGWTGLLLSAYLLKRSLSELLLFLSIDLAIGFAISLLTAVLSQAPIAMLVVYALPAFTLLLLVPVAILYNYTKSH